ncbi:MAG TPA: VIT domain-containing protein [Gemmatimonadaceae bacterium]|nr:VIT domain-containing protein [Gemmatimonadaceae bacterium]
MRTLLQFIAASLFATTLPAQGILMPLPCTRICPADGPCRPCGQQGPTVVRQSSDVRVDLSDRVLRYEVTEIFVNRGSGIGEADYVFPLPRGAAFQDLKLSINGELVSGEMMNAGKARGIYEEIVRRQRDPALVEWMGYGMLRTRIFPIAPGERKKVVVRFQMVAEREGDALRIDYFRGKGVANAQPRLARRGDDDIDIDPRGRGSFSLTYPASEMYGNPYSPTHSVNVTREGNRREVAVRGDAAEITLLLPVRRPSAASISVLTHAPRGEDGFALITVAPPLTASRVTARDVTLVLDVSGSMAGTKIRQARAAGKQVLATLSPSDRFKLIDFSTDVRTFRDDFVRATPENLREASRYLESLDASGSTNISGALDAALEDDSPSGRLGLVLFVTDGEPTVGDRDPERIAARVSRNRGTRRIFSFGVGADLNAALVERLAIEGRGTAHFVRPEESVERAVSIVASRLTNPVVTDVRVTADGVRLLKRHPSEAADIFTGQDYVLLARYDGSGTASVRFDGQTPSGPVSWTTRVDFPETSRENPFIARLWATQRVGYLSAEKRKGGRSREVDAEIRELGERYAIPTEFTSYLVLEPGMQIDNMGVPGVISAPASPEMRRRGDAGMGAQASAAAPPPPATSVQSFESARAAAVQRSATNLSVAEDAAFSKSANVRRVGARSFVMRNGTWIDSRRTESMRVIKVKPFSEAYFKLIDAIPDLREVFALGDKVVVAGKKFAIQVAADGAENLSNSDLAAVQADW